MFLKNNFFKILTLTIFFFTKPISANQDELKKSINYLKNLKFFSSSFIQSNDSDVSEGKIFIGQKRVRVEYEKPSKILVILDENKAMYYNYDLEEDEFFDPKDTQAWFFFDIFNNPDFFSDSKIITKNNNLVLEKIGENKSEKYNIKVFFENNPMLIRKIVLTLDDVSLVISIFNHKHDVKFDKKFFKLINPIFFD